MPVRPALIVVDLLNDFFERSPRLAAQRGALVSRTNSLTGSFRARGWPVIWVRQEFAPDLHDAFGEMRAKQISVTVAGTPGCQLLPELERRPDERVVVKKRYSAFFGTSLAADLSALGATTVVIAGVNTHACVRMTAIDAYQHDFDVVLVEDAVASSDDEHHRVTIRYMKDKIARVLSSAEVLSAIGP
ncbi:MAG TPA: isochorismatase family cysteine hydrolase [Polyangia bacterium]|nr:isochorismatase family cysteine hydrolase [Polyangia bacterium]